MKREKMRETLLEGKIIICRGQVRVYTDRVPVPLEPDPPPQKLTLGKAEFESVNEPVPAGQADGNDPMNMLRQNRTHEKAAGTVFDQSPAPAPRKYRKYRDYLTVLVVGDAMLGYMLFFQQQNPYEAVPLIAGLVLFSAGWSWHMLVVVDDY